MLLLNQMLKKVRDLENKVKKRTYLKEITVSDKALQEKVLYHYYDDYYKEFIVANKESVDGLENDINFYRRDIETKQYILDIKDYCSKYLMTVGIFYLIVGGFFSIVPLINFLGLASLLLFLVFIGIFYLIKDKKYKQNIHETFIKIIINNPYFEKIEKDSNFISSEKETLKTIRTQVVEKVMTIEKEKLTILNDLMSKVEVEKVERRELDFNELLEYNKIRLRMFPENYYIKNEKQLVVFQTKRLTLEISDFKETNVYFLEITKQSPRREWFNKFGKHVNETIYVNQEQLNELVEYTITKNPDQKYEENFKKLIKT